MHVLALQDYIRQSTNMWWDSRCIMNEMAEWTRRLNKKTITSNRYCAWGWARQRPPKPAAMAWDWRSRKLPGAMGTVVAGLSYEWDILFGYQADRFHWGCTAASLSGGNRGKEKKRMRGISQNEGTGKHPGYGHCSHWWRQDKHQLSNCMWHHR